MSQLSFSLSGSFCFDNVLQTDVSLYLMLQKTMQNILIYVSCMLSANHDGLQQNHNRNLWLNSMS